MRESVCLDARYFRYLCWLEVRIRTARAIAGHIKKSSVCVLDKTHSLEKIDKTVSWASFVWSVPIEGSIFLQF